MSAQGRRLRAGDADGNGVDRLSGLSDDVLLKILGGLGTASEAVRTGVLSRRWRGLWTSLRALVFECIDPGAVEAALAQVARRPVLDLLDVRLNVEAEDIDFQRHSLSALLRAAARLAPKKLAFSTGESPTTGGCAVNLPCLDRTVSLEIHMWDTPLAPPRSGEFAALQSLSLRWCSVDSKALLPLCPRLRVLVVEYCLADATGYEAVIHSPSLEEFLLADNCLEHIDIVAPVLKKVTVKVHAMEPVSVSLSAPEVEESEWEFIFDDEEVNVAFGLWRLDGVCLSTVGEHLPCVYIQLTAHSDTLDQDFDFAQVIAQLPVATFSVLDLDIDADGHVLGPLVLHLLRIQPAIQGLNMVAEQPEEEIACPVNCPCKQSSDDWRSESVALTNLEVVEIVGIKGRDHEVDFLKLLFRCAKVLKKMIVRLAEGVSSSESAYANIHTLFKEYPNVKCFIYSNSDKKKRGRTNRTFAQ